MPRGASRDALRILAACGLRAFADGFVWLLLPIYLVELGFSALAIGVIVTSTLAGTALMTLLVGLAAHRYPRRMLLLAPALLMAATGAAFATVVLCYETVGDYGRINSMGGIKTPHLPVLYVALAGTMERVVSRQIGPAFTAATGCKLDITRAPSVALANRIAAGELTPDVYISSDANVMELVMGPANNNRSLWYLPILRSRTVILHSPQSRFSRDFEAVREGTLPWYEVMQRPGLVLRRPNPVIDSGGYRAIFVFDLAERLYNLPGLTQRVLGDNHNEAQYFDRTREFPLIRDGRIDAFVTYITNAFVEGFPFLDLPEEIDQSNPSLQHWYQTASYTNPRGQTFRGAYAAYAATIPVAAANPEAAEEFMRLLLSEQGMTMFERAGFHRFKELRVAGHPAAVPEPLRALIR